MSIAHNAAYWQLQGKSHARHHPARALLAFQNALKADPDDLESWNDLGLLLYRMGHTDKAARSFRELKQRARQHNQDDWLDVADYNLAELDQPGQPFAMRPLSRLLATIFSPHGRIGRTGYWWSLLFVIACVTLAFFFTPLLGVALWSYSVISIKRLRDQNLSPWYALLLLLPHVAPGIWGVIAFGHRAPSPPAA